MTEIAGVKHLIRKRHLKSAPGVDCTAYDKIDCIPNHLLVDLFNKCISEGDAPRDWFTMVLVGLLKPGKKADDPEGYCLVGLECCLVKMLTLLIDIRIREWAEAENIIPDSQNGFREGYRTHNNSFILRCAIDRAHAQGKPLYAAFVDLKNAFPSTHLPTLWLKLYRVGVSGPLFDWLRMLYAKMIYVVRQKSEISSAFKCLIGVLTGDTASPVLWNIYFADLAFPDDPDDVCLDDRPVSHLEQADDVMLFSTTAEGLQRKLDRFYQWCNDNFMTVSIIKSEWMIFGPLPPTALLPTMLVGGNPIKLVCKFKYVGMWFTSTHRYIFATHYTEKAAKARKTTNGSFAAQQYIGSLAPVDGITLYNARVDPHLTFGCEVSLDVDQSLLATLENVQLAYLRRLLRVNSRSEKSFLFTETGLIPLRFRRVFLALGYLHYLINLPPCHLASAALKDSLRLAQSSIPNWATDLTYVLRNILPANTTITANLFSNCETVRSVREMVIHAAQQWALNALQSSQKLILLQDRQVFDVRGFPLPFQPLERRPYLHLLTIPKHRTAYIRFVTSNHSLAVERLRWAERRRPRVPREWRLCRLCKMGIEDEAHAMLQCTASATLVDIRVNYLERLFRETPSLQQQHVEMDSSAFLHAIVHRHATLALTAKFIFQVLELYATVDIWIPAQVLYEP